MKRLAKVVDTSTDGTAGEAEVAVPRAWLAAGATVEVTLPQRLRCHECGGGGCDGCERSGVFRLPESDEERRLEFPLPNAACVLRLRDPVGAGKPDMVLLRLAEGDASDGVRCLTPVERRSHLTLILLAAALAIAALIAIFT